MTGMPAFLQWRASIPFRVELYTLVVPARWVRPLEGF